MANPFSVFRRNQKLMLAIVTIGAMVAFVFLDPVMRYITPGAGVQENPVVVQTRYGALTEQDMFSMRQSRELAKNFLERLLIETIRTEIEHGRIDPRMSEFAFEQLQNMFVRPIMTRTKPGAEEAALETFVLAKQAEQMGVVISDQTINELLREITGDMVSKETVLAVINGLGGGRRISVKRVFDSLRTELMAQKLMHMFSSSLSDIPPAQRFDYFRQLNQRAKVETVALPVSEFASRIADPSAAEVQKLYDQFKERYPDPSLPEPGFKQPKRIAIQYFKADFNKFTEEMKPKITDEEIAEYYEKNKQQFLEVTLPAEKPGDDATDAKPADADTPPAEPGATTTPPASDSDKPAPPAEQPSFDEPDGSVDQLPSFDAERDPQTSAASETQPPASETQPPPSDAQPPATDVQSTSPPTITPPADATNPPADAAAPANAEVEFPTDKPVDTPTQELRYEPLEKVKDKIRDTLAAQKAREKITTILDELKGKMRAYADDVETYNARKATNPGMTPPKPFPFADLAKEHGIEAKELPLSTAADVSNEDIGKVFRIVRTGQMGFGRESFADFAFADSMVVYRPETGQDTDGNDYLYWKSEDQAAFVPPLDSIRDKVVDSWKLIQARELARKRAQEYATQARTAGTPLSQVFADQSNMKVNQTPWFSWLTEGNVPLDQVSQQPRMSPVEGIDHVGREFMETVFGLQPNGIGVAMNHPQNTAYVVRLDEYERSDDELRKEFAIEPAMRYMPVAITDQRKMYVAWLDDMNAKAKVKWLRPADAIGRGAPAGRPLSEDDF